MTALLQRLPDIGPALTNISDVETKVGDFVSILEAIKAGKPTSILAPLDTIVNSIGTQSSIDITRLSEPLLESIQHIENAIPPSTREYLTSIQDVYALATNLIEASPLVQQLGQQQSLQELTTTLLEEAISQFENKLTAFGSEFIDTEAVTSVTQHLALLADLQNDFPANQDELLPFLSKQFFGVAPDLLAPISTTVDTVNDLANGIDDQSLLAPVNQAQQAINQKIGEIIQAIDQIDVGDIATLETISTELDNLQDAINILNQPLTSLYNSVQSTVDSAPWEQIFNQYATILNSIDLPEIQSFDAIISEMQDVIRSLISRMHSTFDIEDITGRIAAMNQTIDEAFGTSSLSAVRNTLFSFLMEVNNTIAEVPTERIQEEVFTLLRLLHRKLNELNIDSVSDTIEEALTDFEQFIKDTLSDENINPIRTAITNALGSVNEIPISTLVSQLSEVSTQIQSAIAELQDELNTHLDTVRQLLSQLDEVSYEPVSNAVIAEIEEIKAKLNAMQPESLSDAERLAIKAALALLESLDLEAKAISGLKQGYHSLDDELRGVLGKLANILTDLSERLDQYHPSQLLTPVNNMLDRFESILYDINANQLVKPLNRQIDKIINDLQSVSPGQLLDPLQAPYDNMMRVVALIDPDEWVAPLNAVYAQVEALLDKINLLPVIDNLTARQQAATNMIRDHLLNAIDSLALPSPLDGLVDQLRPLLEAITEALFSDAESGVRSLSLSLNTDIKLGTLFQPLDEVYDQLIAMLTSLPSEQVTNTFQTLQERLGSGLHHFNPNAIKAQLQSSLDAFSQHTQVLYSTNVAALPDLQHRFDIQLEEAPEAWQARIAEIRTKFVETYSLIDPDNTDSVFAQLEQRRLLLVNTIGTRINALDTGPAHAAYERFQTTLLAVIPGFLQSTVPVTYDTIVQELTNLRPSQKVAVIEDDLARFLQQLQPLSGALEPSFNGFLRTLQQANQFIDPSFIKEPITQIYDSIEAKIRIIDPSALADNIRLYALDPLLEPLNAVNPSQIKTRLDDIYQVALNLIKTQVSALIEDIAQTLNTELNLIRDVFVAMLNDVKNTLDALASAIGDSIDALRDLVFKDVLERIESMVENLSQSFDKELERVRNAFNQMLAAIPV